MTQDHREETRVISGSEQTGWFAWVRDQLYDFVYQEGDFALQMVGDLFRGYEPKRENKHLERQIRHREKRASQPIPKSKKTNETQNKQSQIREKPLSYNEKLAFVDLLKRETGEGQIEYWKRKKWLLSLPNETIREMLTIRSDIDKQIATDTIEVEANSITQSYQQRLSKHEARKQMKHRVMKRTQKRGRTR